MLCRVCLKDTEQKLHIFDEAGVKLQIADILEKHLWFRPLPSDTLSSIVCQPCWHKLHDFHQFYQTVELAHKQYNGKSFNVLAKDIPAINHAVELVETVCDVKNEDTVENIWQGSIRTTVAHAEVGEDNRLAVNPLYEPEVPEQVVVKDEVPECDNLDEFLIHEIVGGSVGSSSDSSSDEDSSRNSDYKPEKSTVPPPSKIQTRKRRRGCASSSLAKQPKSKTNNKNSSPKRRRQQRDKRCWTTPRDDEMVRKHLPLNCELCGFIVENYNNMIMHFHSAHRDTRPYILCCGRRISKRQRVVQHAYHHEDPNYFQCEICKKSFSDNYVLRSHMLSHHPAEDELIFQCDQCDKRFSRRYLLQLHKPVHIPVEERRFICTKCPTPKAFASDHLRQIHDNMRHKRATNVCHVCAKEIRDNQAFEKHVRLHFEDSGPRVKCPRPGCDRWLKDDDNLKQHLRRHNDEGKIITCEQCGKSVKNRRALSSHMSYAHSNTLFSCGECKKTFKKAITLKEHMAQHTGETLYTCPFCTRTFNSNANMHSHKKKMHPIEWDVWRKTKTGSSQHTKSNRHVLETVANSLLPATNQEELNVTPQDTIPGAPQGVLPVTTPEIMQVTPTEMLQITPPVILKSEEQQEFIQMPRSNMFQN